MYGPHGPWSAIVHVIVRRPVVSVAIAALGLGATVSIVNRTPGGPGIHDGSRAVLERVEEELEQKHPELATLFPRYEAAYADARARRERLRGSPELPDRVVKDVLSQFGSGLTVADVRANAQLSEAVERAYFYDAIHRYNGGLDFAVSAYVNVTE